MERFWLFMNNQLGAEIGASGGMRNLNSTHQTRDEAVAAAKHIAPVYSAWFQVVDAFTGEVVARG